jgi:hypothetical protein
MPRRLQLQFTCLALASLLAHSAPAEQPAGEFTEADLPLPAWSPDEWQRLARESAPPLLGGLLPTLGEDPTLGGQQLGPALSPKYPDGPPPMFGDSPESARIGLSLFLPEGLMTSAAPSAPPDTRTQPTPLIHLRDVTPELLASVENWPGDDPLIDPGSELPETPAEDLRRFLGYHAEQADIPIVVLLLAKDERLPAQADLERFAQGTLSKRRAALLAYPMGEPWRARLFLPRAAHQAVSSAFLTRLVEACLAEAASATLPEDQLHEYVVQLSIRLFWLQKELAKSTSSSLAFADTAKTPPLTEVGHPAVEPSAPAPTAAAAPASTLRLPNASLLTIAILGTVLLTLTGRRVIRSAKKAAKQRRHRQIWTLPEPETESRLSGAFCGGAGAWGSWK